MCSRSPNTIHHNLKAMLTSAAESAAAKNIVTMAILICIYHIGRNHYQAHGYHPQTAALVRFNNEITTCKLLMPMNCNRGHWDVNNFWRLAPKTYKNSWFIWLSSGNAWHCSQMSPPCPCMGWGGLAGASDARPFRLAWRGEGGREPRPGTLHESKKKQDTC